MSFSTILTANGLTVTQWDDMLFQEYLDKLFWKPWMGARDTAAIHVDERLTGMAGDTIKFGIRSEVIGGRLTGEGQMAGNEGAIEHYPFSVVTNIERQSVKMENVKISDQRVAFKLMNDARPALSDKNKRNLEADITTALTDTSTGRVRGRYQYGATESNWNATHATALANITDANDKMTTNMIKRCKTKARVPEQGAYAKLRPLQIKSGPQGGLQEWYMCVMHTYAANNLVDFDAAWKNAQLNIPPTSNMNNQIFTGSSFLGVWQGVLMYEWESMPLVSSTTTVAHSLFLGAQAGILGWSKRPTFGEEMSDYGHVLGFETWEIRGVKKVVWDRNTVNGTITNEDNGVIHLFSAAVNT